MVQRVVVQRAVENASGRLSCVIPPSPVFRATVSAGRALRGYSAGVTDSPETQPTIIVLVASDQDLADLRDAPELAALLDQSQHTCTHAGVIVDVSGLETLTSRGLAELIVVRRMLCSKAGCIRVAGANAHVQRVMRVCHLDEFFGVDASVEKAKDNLLCP